MCNMRDDTEVHVQHDRSGYHMRKVLSAHRVTVSVVIRSRWCKVSQDDIVHGPRVNPSVAVGCSTAHVLPGVSGGITSHSTGKTARAGPIVNSRIASIPCEPLH